MRPFDALRIAFTFVVLTYGNGIVQANDAELQNSTGLNFRKKIHEFAVSQREKMWALEDAWIAGERVFQDGLRKKLRESESELNALVADSPDWKKAQRDKREKTRSVEAELKQRIKVHREQRELELLRFQQERDVEFKAVLGTLESELKKYRKEKSYGNAESDFRESRDELKNQIKDWNSRMKLLRVKELY